MSLSQNEADLASQSCPDHRVRGRRYAFVCGRTAPAGPSGPDGGRILAAGIPEDVARTPGSATGPWLAEYLGLPEAQPVP